MAKKPQTFSFFMNAATRHGVFVNRFASGQFNEMLPFLEEVKKNIAGELAGKELTDFSRSRYVATLAEITALIQSIYDKMGLDLKDNMLDFAKYETEFNANLYDKGTASSANFVLPSANQIEAAIFTDPFELGGEKTNIDKLLKQFSDAKADQIVNTIKQGVIAGKANGDIISDIADLTSKTQANNMYALVRTVVGQVSDNSRDLVYQANSDIVSQVQWVATLDDSCCIECAFLDGETFPADDYPDKPHFACRCTTIPIVDPEYDITSGIQLERPSVGSDGAESVDADTTYGDWLAQQSKEFQVEVLGDTKQALFDKGGLELKDFVDHNHQPYTLDQLKEMEPMAFEKAGLTKPNEE